jgi:4-hydroxybenzoate polyprenyltransferase
LALQAAILVLINGLLPKVTHGMDMMWIAFQAWAVYFVVGCTAMNGVKAWIGYLTGILASIAIIMLMGLPGIKDLPTIGGMNLGMAVAVFIVVIPAIMTENLKNMVPALFIGSGAFFASLGHASLAASLKAADAVGCQTTTFLYAAQTELIYCALGLSFGYITVFWRGKYEASLAK